MREDFCVYNPLNLWHRGPITVDLLAFRDCATTRGRVDEPIGAISSVLETGLPTTLTPAEVGCARR